MSADIASQMFLMKENCEHRPLVVLTAVGVDILFPEILRLLKKIVFTLAPKIVKVKLMQDTRKAKSENKIEQKKL